MEQKLNKLVYFLYFYVLNKGDYGQKIFIAEHGSNSRTSYDIS